jgi:E3 ubiquitin-protein ligase MARCH6
MPAKLPSYLYVRRALFQSIYLLRYSLRAMFVSFAWLALLPLGNIYVWRLHFWIVDVIVWGLVGGIPPPSRSRMLPALNGTINAGANIRNSTLLNATASILTNNSISNNETIAPTTFGLRIPFPLVFVEKLLMRAGTSADYRKAFDSLARDTFEGQVLTCAVVIFFVAIFLLREWCLQNLPQPVEGLAFAGPPQAIPPPNAFRAGVAGRRDNRANFEARLEEATRLEQTWLRNRQKDQG